MKPYFPFYAEQHILPRIHVAGRKDQELGKPFDAYGDVFKISRRDNYMRWYTFERYVKTFLKFCERNGSRAGILEVKRYEDKLHQKPYYHHDYFLVYITNPVAGILEQYINERMEA